MAESKPKIQVYSWAFKTTAGQGNSKRNHSMPSIGKPSEKSIKQIWRSIDNKSVVLLTSKTKGKKNFLKLKKSSEFSNSQIALQSTLKHKNSDENLLTRAQFS